MKFVKDFGKILFYKSMQKLRKNMKLSDLHFCDFNGVSMSLFFKPVSTVPASASVKIDVGMLSEDQASLSCEEVCDIQSIGCSPDRTTSPSSIIVLMGLHFEWVSEFRFYRLVDREYSLGILKSLCESLFEFMSSINDRGYVTLDRLECSFIKEVEHQLDSLGFEKQILGNSDVPYTLWYNLLFISFYYKVTKCLMDLRMCEELQVRI